jgi:hypothetical protein
LSLTFNKPNENDFTVKTGDWITLLATDDEEVKKKMPQLDPAIASISQKLAALSTQPEFRYFAEKRAKDLRDYASVIKDHEDQLKLAREEGRIETALNLLKTREPAISVESISKAAC